MSKYDTDELLPRLVAFPTNVAIDEDMYGIGVGMLRPPAHRPAVGLAAILNPATDAYVDTSDMFDEVCQLLDSTLLLDTASDVDTDAEDVLVWALDLDTEPLRLLDEGLVSGDEDDEPLVALVDVPRDFLVGGSSRGIELRLPWDGLLLFSDLERLLDEPVDEDWPDGVGELFTGTLRRSPIVALAIIPAVYLVLPLAGFPAHDRFHTVTSSPAASSSITETVSRQHYRSYAGTRADRRTETQTAATYTERRYTRPSERQGVVVCWLLYIDVHDVHWRRSSRCRRFRDVARGKIDPVVLV